MTGATPREAAFPQRLRSARDLRGKSQAQLADEAGFQPSAISRFETGASKPSFENLRRLAEALRVSTDYLLGLADEPTGTAAAVSAPLYRKLEGLTDEQRAFAEKFLSDLAELGRK